MVCRTANVPSAIFRMRGLQDVPGHRGRIHPAAQHGDQVGGKDETQRALAENVTHLSTLAEEGTAGITSQARVTGKASRKRRARATVGCGAGLADQSAVPVRNRLGERAVSTHDPRDRWLSSKKTRTRNACPINDNAVRSPLTQRGQTGSGEPVSRVVSRAVCRAQKEGSQRVRPWCAAVRPTAQTFGRVVNPSILLPAFCFRRDSLAQLGVGGERRAKPSRRLGPQAASPHRRPARRASCQPPSAFASSKTSFFTEHMVHGSGQLERGWPSPWPCRASSRGASSRPSRPSLRTNHRQAASPKAQRCALPIFSLPSRLLRLPADSCSHAPAGSRTGSCRPRGTGGCRGSRRAGSAPGSCRRRGWCAAGGRSRRRRPWRARSGAASSVADLLVELVDEREVGLDRLPHAGIG